ncbi:MAG TPA: type II secretion system protein [Patescibacteria group bacterium]|nr:type II secretion system protein [Patescibacteria group bacterium]
MLYKKLNLKKIESGFTLIELLIVIGILAVLMGIVLVAINPAKQFASANDTKRRSDVNTILNAINQYSADHHGTLPSGIATNSAGLSFDTSYDISSNATNLCSLLVSEYVAALPVDPSSGTDGTTIGNSVTNCDSDYNTGYYVYQSPSDGRVTVFAQSQVDSTAPISVTR